MDFYPISMFPYILTILGVIVTVALALWVAKKDQSARPVGLVAFMPIVFVTGWTWFRDLPSWTAWLCAATVLVLFIVGMTKHEDRDDKWHYGALGVALFGKLVCWFLPWMLSFIMTDFDPSEAPVLLYLLVIAALIGLGALISRWWNSRNDEYVDDEPAPGHILM